MHLLARLTLHATLTSAAAATSAASSATRITSSCSCGFSAAPCCASSLTVKCSLFHKATIRQIFCIFCLLHPSFLGSVISLFLLCFHKWQLHFACDSICDYWSENFYKSFIVLYLTSSFILFIICSIECRFFHFNKIRKLEKIHIFYFVFHQNARNTFLFHTFMLCYTKNNLGCIK